MITESSISECIEAYCAILKPTRTPRSKINKLGSTMLDRVLRLIAQYEMLLVTDLQRALLSLKTVFLVKPEPTHAPIFLNPIFFCF